MEKLVHHLDNKYNTKIINNQIFLPENLKRSGDSDLKGLPKVQLLGTGDVFATLNYIERIIVRYHWQTADIAPRLRGDTLLQTARNIWTWCRTMFRYTNDTMGTEELRTPYRSWVDRHRGIDCDDFTILVSSILIQLDIRPQLVMVAFNGNAGYSHIMVGIDCTVLAGKPFGGIIIDPVDTEFNRILPNITKTHIRDLSISKLVSTT